MCAKGLVCTETRHGGIGAITHIRFHVYRHFRLALARDHEHRRGDESPNGDLALPRQRLASASPGVASAPSPTLRVPSPRRTRTRPSPHTNFHESLECALQNSATESLKLNGTGGTDRTCRTCRTCRTDGTTPPLTNSQLLHFQFVQPQGRIREPRRRVLAGGESPQGWMRRVTSREGRLGKWVSCKWGSGGVDKRPSRGDGTRRRQSRTARFAARPRFVVARQRQHQSRVMYHDS